jgi:hypothetical protein
VTTTSRTFDVMERLYTLLNEETVWPPHPQSSEVPLVVLGGLVTEASREPVVIQGTPPDIPELDWAVLGKVGVDERFAVRVLVSTMVPGVTGIIALRRLRDLVHIVEVKLRDQSTGRPAGELPAECTYWRVGRISPQLSLGVEGVIGDAAIDVLVTARI